MISLYHYTSLEKLELILPQSRMKMNLINNVKDTTESKMALQATKAALLKSRNEILCEDDERRILELRNQTYCCCLSEKKYCPYLAYYYGDRNKGVILEFSANLTFSSSTAVHSNGHYCAHSSIIRVRYEPFLFDTDKMFDFSHKYLNAVFYKSKEFDIESEVRIYHHRAEEEALRISCEAPARNNYCDPDDHISSHIEFDNNDMFFYFGNSSQNCKIFQLSNVISLKHCERKNQIQPLLKQNNYSDVGIKSIDNM